MLQFCELRFKTTKKYKYLLFKRELSVTRHSPYLFKLKSDQNIPYRSKGSPEDQRW